jgi:hypothetical protein
MKRFATFAVLIFLLTISIRAQDRQLVQEEVSSSKRTALVIGNADYSTSPLKNPVNDATDIAAALRDAGFEVIYKQNLNQTEMKRAIREFGAKLKANGGVGLFYFAGHGVQVKGTNYLVPVAAAVENEEEVEYEAIDAGFVLAQMESARNPMNIVILDACRNNPFARSFRSESKGLAQMDAPSGTIIAYATAPGSVASDGAARNGLYTQELLKSIRVKDLDIEELFKRVRISVRNLTGGKQTPWESSSLTGSFQFTVSAERTPSNQTTVPPVVTQKVETRPSAQAIELTYWDSIKNSTNVEDFQAYLRKYPSGEFADIARNRIKAMTTVSKPEPVYPSNRDSDAVIGIGTYIPELNAKVTNLRFFESPYDQPNLNDRVYARRFPRSSRFICWHLDIEYPEKNERKNFSIRAVYYDSNNNVLQDKFFDKYIEKGWKSSFHSDGLGNKDGYYYGAGKYRVELYMGEQKIASGWFEVY